MCRCLIALVLLFSAAVTAAPAWTWVDANGRRHFSDRPVPGATRIDLPDGPGARPQLPAASATVPRAGAAQNAIRPATPGPDSAGGYTRIDILNPVQEQTLWNIEGRLPVELAIEPALQRGHAIDIILDGERTGISSSATSLTVPEVYRGQHTLQAAIVDLATGQEVIRSLAITIQVQQTSILNPNNPNFGGT